MNHLERRFAAVVAVGFAVAPAFAFQGNTGGAASQFLNIGAGARALGMGEAFGPVAEGANAIYWNPAGLASMGRSEVTYTRQEFLDYFHHDYIAYATPVRALGGAIGGSFTHFTQNSLPLVTNSNITIGRFAPHAEVLSLAYGHAFAGEAETGRERYTGAWYLVGASRPIEPDPEMWTGPFMLGVSLKTILESYYDQSSAAVALDAGALYKPVQLEALRLSAVVRNLGSRQEFVRESESLPVEVDLGASLRQKEEGSQMIGAFEVALPYYGLPYAKLGGEYRSELGGGVSWAVRGGYKSQTAYGLGPLAGITVGVGASFRRFSVDFGFQPMAELGQTYRMSVAMHW